MSTQFLRVLGRRSGGLGLAAPATDETPEHTLQDHELSNTLMAPGADAAYARSAAVTRRTQVVPRPLTTDGRCRPNGRCGPSTWPPALHYGRHGGSPNSGHWRRTCRSDASLGEMRIDAAGRVQTTHPKHPSRCPP